MGQGPLGGGGIPIPRIHHKHGGEGSSGEKSVPTFSADGKTVSNDGKKLLIATADGRTITLTLSPQTKFTRSGSEISPDKVTPRTTVHVEAAENGESYLTAMEVNLVKDAPPGVPIPSTGATAASTPSNPDGTNQDAIDQDLTRPTVLKTPDVPDRPVLQHGAPKLVSRSEKPVEQAKIQQSPAKQSESTDSSSSDFTIGDNASPAAKQVPSKRDELLDHTREWVQTFTNGLPNFVCEQLTTRYIEESRTAGWEAQDVVGAKVVYEDGHENYKNISVNGHSTNKSMLEIGGATSTGEFASILQSLLLPGSGAQFNYFRSASIGQTSAAIYDFKVPLQRSNWTITIGGQTLRPAYSGSIWVDRKTSEVRRIEMQADNIPKDFPSDSVQSTVDYDSVPLGTAKFLLPVHAENLSCQRGSPICSKNAIDFRNYHKFSGESTITFGNSK